MRILDEARDVLRVELNALQSTIDALDERFERAMRLLRQRRGKIVVTGVGKSGLIAQKIAATFSSTGSVAVFMHAADGIHGDLGVVAPGDVALALSYSGETDEVLSILPVMRQIGAKIIALVGNDQSRLAQSADAVVTLVAPEEADHLKLAPTSSALAALAIGDAMAALLSKWRGFRPEDFALYHPGGQLGRRLLLHVRDLMRGRDEAAVLTPDAGIHEVVEALTKPAQRGGALGAVLIQRSARDQRLAGIITDGDLRRAMLQSEGAIFGLKARDLMTGKPTTVGPDAKAEEALRLMEDRPSQIAVLPVIDERRRVLGLLRLHDLLQIGFHTGNR